MTAFYLCRLKPLQGGIARQKIARAIHAASKAKVKKLPATTHGASLQPNRECDIPRRRILHRPRLAVINRVSMLRTKNGGGWERVSLHVSCHDSSTPPFPHCDSQIRILDPPPSPAQSTHKPLSIPHPAGGKS